MGVKRLMMERDLGFWTRMNNYMYYEACPVVLDPTTMMSCLGVGDWVISACPV